jgi:hypothetical protein
VPLKNQDGDVIGVLQLLNAQYGETGEVVPFSKDIQPLVEALTSQAAISSRPRKSSSIPSSS